MDRNQLGISALHRRDMSITLVQQHSSSVSVSVKWVDGSLERLKYSLSFVSGHLQISDPTSQVAQTRPNEITIVSKDICSWLFGLEASIISE